MTALPDAQARFLDLIETHRRLLYKVARVYGQSPADREDLMQEAISQLWRSFHRFDGRYTFSTWMFRIALNVAISWKRRERTQTQHLVPDGESVLVTVGAMTGAIEEDEDMKLLYRFIEGFDELNKALLMLYLEGQSHQEISAVLGISPTNVATKIGRLKDRLRANFRSAGRLNES